MRVEPGGWRYTPATGTNVRTRLMEPSYEADAGTPVVLQEAFHRSQPASLCLRGMCGKRVCFLESEGGMAWTRFSPSPFDHHLISPLSLRLREIMRFASPASPTRVSQMLEDSPGEC